MTRTDAETIFDILVHDAGCRLSHREPFIAYLTNNTWGEYRFQGNLGFGGKFYFGPGECRVGQYREDETPESRKAVDRINAKLQSIHAAC